MKKIIMLTLLLFAIFSPTSNAALSSLTFNPADKIGVVIIGPSEFKTEDFFKYTHESLSSDEKIRTILLCNNEMQGLWEEYWLDKGDIDERPPRKADMLDFCQYSKCDKVLFLMFKDPHAEQEFDWWTGLSTRRVAVSVKAFLVDNQRIIQSSSATKEGSSTGSMLRARRKSFQKAIMEIGAVMKINFKLTSKTRVMQTDSII